MGWGLNTPVSVGDSTHAKRGFKAGFLITAGLGLLFVFCLPGQMSQANYHSVRAVPIDGVSLVESPQLDAEILLAGAATTVEPEPKMRGSIIDAASVVETAKRNSIPVKKPVQMASLDLELPRVEKPKIYIAPETRQTVLPKAKIPQKPQVRPRLQKKLFGTVELRFDDERKIKAWSSVYYKFLGDTQSIKNCLNKQAACNDPFMEDWTAQLRPLRNLSTFDKIAAVNSIANRKTYADDQRNYGKSDYWAGPREFLARGGDCEDYALLKFASLLALGVNEKDLRLVVGRLSDGTPHAFLAANVGTNEYILDNRQSSVYLTQNRKDYVPKYSMNLSYRWSHVVPGATTT